MVKYSSRHMMNVQMLFVIPFSTNLSTILFHPKWMEGQLAADFIKPVWCSLLWILVLLLPTSPFIISQYLIPKHNNNWMALGCSLKMNGRAFARDETSEVLTLLVDVACNAVFSTASPLPNPEALPNPKPFVLFIDPSFHLILVPLAQQQVKWIVFTS